MIIKKIILKKYEDHEFMFKFETGLKFVAISLGFLLTTLLFTYLFLKMDLIYLMTRGYSETHEFKDLFYSFIYASLVNKIQYLVLVLFFIFFIGFYLSVIMMRPFRMISRHCEARLLENKECYRADYFSDLKLLTSFSFFFFSKMDKAENIGKLEKDEIPYEFTRIHKPIFEKNFFINYFLILVFFALLTSFGIVVLNNSMREQVLIFATKVLSTKEAGNPEVHFFLEEQFSVANIGISFLICIHFFVYCLFGIHLYGKISGPSFAIFATMRSFLKGNYHNRIHLIGYVYLRDDCRKINKYLDYIQKKYNH